MLERFRPSNRTATANAPARKAVRTAAPILLRFVGCADEPVAVNSELFTLGAGSEDTVLLPPALRRSGSIKLRFTRGSEGWRIVAADDRVFFINQNACRGLTTIKSGDVVRLEPGGTGVQFLVRSQFDAVKQFDVVNKEIIGKPSPSDSAESSEDSVRTKPALPLRNLLIALALLAAMGLAYYAGVSSAPTPTAPPVTDQP